MLLCPRMTVWREKRTTTAKSQSGGPGPTRSSSRRRNSSLRPSIPASPRTKVTCALRSASPITQSRCRPTRRRRSLALSAKARASTFPRSCHPWQQAAAACRRLQPRSPPHAVCCVPVSKTEGGVSSCGHLSYLYICAFGAVIFRQL